MLMETSYLVTHKQTGKTMLFTYDLNGLLTAFKLDFNMTASTVEFYRQNFPFTLGDLAYFKQNAQFRVDILQQDLSFDNFWKTYNNKVGNKPRAEKLWNALTDNDKAKALNYIRQYDNHLILNQGLTKLYPETYLNQKRFNNG